MGLLQESLRKQIVFDEEADGGTDQPYVYTDKLTERQFLLCQVIVKKERHYFFLTLGAQLPEGARAVNLPPGFHAEFRTAGPILVKDAPQEEELG